MAERNDSSAHGVILIVDDDAGQRRLLEPFLSQQGYDVQAAASAPEALELLARRSDVGMVISDMRMPGMTGLEMLRKLRESHPTLPVLLVTAYPDIRDAVAATRDGAVDYLQKPIDLDELLDQVRRALGRGRATGDLTPSKDALPPGVVAQSPQMRLVVRDALVVAATDSRILITGESGVGKEVVADLVHSHSARAAGPLVKVNCAAIPEPLLESELFGHEKGSFTGATARRIGCFEAADSGTILLDEIGEMPLSLQAKLLRVTENGSFRRVGDSQDRHADARLLATTNRNLQEEVKKGTFREDLFFRLNVFEIHVPPLRERRVDIMPLANLFASRFANGRARFSASTVSCLEVYDWPGNVRELRNAMERAAMMARGDMLLPEHLPQRILEKTRQAAAPATMETAVGRMEEVERSVILQTLRDNRFNRSETARVLGISRRALLYKLQRYRELGYAVEVDEDSKAASKLGN
jgi:DNA-binding NtrC family response regulator